MNNKYIDIDLTEQILSNINNGVYDNIKAVTVKDIPNINNKNIIDRANLEHWSCDLNMACDNLRSVNPNLREYILGTRIGKISEHGSGRILLLSKGGFEEYRHPIIPLSFLRDPEWGLSYKLYR